MTPAALPTLPARAAYLHLRNPARRNALSLACLRDLRKQLIAYNTSPADGSLKILPPFRRDLLEKLEHAASTATTSGTDTDTDLSWLVSASAWQTHRSTLPTVLVLRASGPVFSAGHDLSELSSLSHDEVKETFALCAEVMTLIRRSPAPVVGVIQGLATAAGAQLALTTDLPIALADTQFRLPGETMGLPCTSPSTAVSRRVGNAVGYRMFAVAEPVRADQLNGAVDVVAVPECDGLDDVAKGTARNDALEARVAQVVEQIAERTAGQPQALGKWAYWTQAGINGCSEGGDGYEEAVEWAGRMMALHARGADAREGMKAFLQKRKPAWVTSKL